MIFHEFLQNQFMVFGCIQKLDSKPRIADETRAVGPGDAIAIPPGAEHQITNTGREILKFICCCAPGYENDDTVLCQQQDNL